MKSIKWETLFISIGLIVLASVCYNLGLATLFLGGKNLTADAYTYTIMFCMPLGFIILPYIVARKFQLLPNKSKVSIDFKILTVLFALLILFDVLVFKTGESFNQLIIATSEEFLFRYLIFNILCKDMSKWQAIIINSLLFALILHLNYSFLDNLIFRFPIAVVFSYIAQRFGLQYSIASHWLYNLIVVKFGI